MNPITLLLAVTGLIAADGFASVNAQSPYASNVPRSATFIGLGGSYNSVDFGNHHIFAQGVSNVYQNGTLVAFGAAGGPADSQLDAQSTFAPAAQLGYFRHFANSKWLWGAKFSYSYLEASSTNQNVVVPQVGSFTSATPDTFTGNVIIRSFESSITHQMALVPFIGHSFEKSFIYFGAGPTLSRNRSHLNGVIGFADINGEHTNITGTPANFSSAPWVYGGAAILGATYFLDSTWFLDVGYAFIMTQKHSSAFSGPFASSTSGYVDTGTLSGNYSGRETTQSLTISINRAF